MYKHYFFNDNRDIHGRHEVHTEDCAYIPNVRNRSYIGYFSSCQEAISAAKQKNILREFDGCYYCCRECHKG
jgi:hypothetical protein